jgi:methionyl-tRNA formyltransferase
VATRSAWLDARREALWAQPGFRFIPDVVLPAPPEGAGAERGGGPRVAFCGFPSDYSLAFLLGLLELEVDVVAVITSPGAHAVITGVNALSQIADHIGVPLLRLWRVNDEHARLDLASLELEGVVMASFDQIVGARALAIPTNGWLNVHPSALPHYRGPEPVYWVIADGETRTGITLHRAVAKFDAGPVLAQKLVDVRPDDTAGTLTRRLSAAGVEVLGGAVDRLLAGDPGKPLDMTDATYRPSVGHRRLDRAPDAPAAERMVRAGEPNMPAWTVLDGRPVYAHAAELAPDCAGAGLCFDDGCLCLTAFEEVCGCHHDAADCPHREG